MRTPCSWPADSAACILPVVVLAAGLIAAPLQAGDGPYFITYSHHMEEPGSLEIAANQVVASPPGGNAFISNLTELEYGIRTWWTTEAYLSSQFTSGEGGVFTGIRWENRFRPLLREHWINPVLYVEYENINEADKSLREIVGHDTVEDQLEPMSETRHEREQEIETKLILSSNFKGWNLSENLIGAKNFKNEPWEFGYAVGLSRPLALAASAEFCRFCRENFRAGIEFYGGLGAWNSFGLHNTSHYLAPALAWELPGGTTLQVSPSFGLTGESHRFLLRFAVAYEVNQFSRLFRRTGSRDQ